MIALKRAKSWFSFSAKMSQIVKRDQQRAQRVQENINQYAI